MKKTNIEKLDELLQRQVELKDEMNVLMNRSTQIIHEFRTIARDIREVSLNILREETVAERGTQPRD